MHGELLIRPSHNDHEVISDLLAPGSSAAVMVGAQRPLISRLVVDAHVVAKRPEFAEAAEGAGIPFLVDPLTPLLQGELRDEDPWAKLSFGRAEQASPADYANSSTRAFVAAVVEFELEHGATAVIPPYPYVGGPDDRWFAVELEWLRETRRYMDANSVSLPLLPVICGQLRDLGSEKSWAHGLDVFARAAYEFGADGLGLCLSPAGNGKESYNKVLRLFQAADHLKAGTGLPVFSWRQGVFGPALVAAGLDGYETGIGTSEQSSIKSNIAARRPPKPGQKPGRGGRGIYLEPLGRSVNRRVAQLLLANVSMRAKVMCTDERCCPHGVTSTLDHSREHAVRSRARELDMLAALPARSWRLNHMATKAQGALTLGHQANRLLAEVGEDLRIQTTGLESLQRVTEELRRTDAEGRATA